MIPSLMVYSLLTSLLLAGAARALDELCRTTWKAPARFVWLAALLGTLALTAAAPLRDRGGTEFSLPRPSVVLGALRVEAWGRPWGWALPGASNVAWGEGTPWRIRFAVRDALHDGALFAAKATPPSVSTSLGILWLCLSLALLATGVATLDGYQMQYRTWPRRRLNGFWVRVSPRVGPAVIGLLDPEIVLPRWLANSANEERRLVVLHEREHLLARDSATLAAGCLAAVLLAWNPVAWWMLLRLRLAVEVDCDTRVLRLGVEPYKYGSMLIGMSAHASGVSLGTPALAGFPSNLERRLLAMTRRVSRGAAARGAALGVIGVGAILAACEAHLPTIEGRVRTNNAPVQATASIMWLSIFGDNDVSRPGEGGGASGSDVNPVTTGYSVIGSQGRKLPGVGPAQWTEVTPATAASALRAYGRSDGSLPATNTVLIVVNGTIGNRVSPSADIESVRVVKGTETLRAQYGDPRAAVGVVLITTKAPVRNARPGYVVDNVVRTVTRSTVEITEISLRSIDQESAPESTNPRAPDSMILVSTPIEGR